MISLANKPRHAHKCEKFCERGKKRKKMRKYCQPNCVVWRSSEKQRENKKKMKQKRKVKKQKKKKKHTHKNKAKEAPKISRNIKTTLMNTPCAYKAAALLSSSKG